jgi:hypothetical protein
MEVAVCPLGLLYHPHAAPRYFSLGNSADRSATVRLAAWTRDVHGVFLQRSVYTAGSYRGLSILPVLTEVCLYCRFLQRSVYTAGSYSGPPPARKHF